ncbi:nucleotide triphosphate diphosphatase NUDT15 [Pseudoalteromonas luteoviolacea]|uniref:nucleotide triphosphate diphosphatase NUDT15 n=1 Tax=Pseudoalteromonas luteoviolacea TaxID=43657 RepID=UPI001B35DD94|nr:NUDIX hydrolase [Pseudoalteromonas luteoviolacea]MBQ4837311.1 NUDIX domain-containing protein [Pseudoalteromonas luteoviolacea]
MSKAVRVGVGVIIKRGDKILLGERIGAHGANTWATPGGHLEFGERIECCAKREVFEETGLSVTEIKEVGFTNDIFISENKHYITIFVIAQCRDGDAKVLEPNKCKQWRWFSLDELPKPLFIPMANFLKEQASPLR